MYVQNVPVCTGNTSTCVNTCGCGAGTHGDVLNVHTGEEGGGHRQFCLLKFAHVGVITCPRGSTKKPMDATYFQFENRSNNTLPRQHVAEYSIFSLHLNTLFNSRHMTQRHTTQQNTPQHRSKEKRRRDERDEERQR